MLNLSEKPKKVSTLINLVKNSASPVVRLVGKTFIHELIVEQIIIRGGKIGVKLIASPFNSKRGDIIVVKKDDITKLIPLFDKLFKKD